MRLLTFSFLKNCKYKSIYYGMSRLISGGVLQPDIDATKEEADPKLVEISPSWKEDMKPELRATVLKDMQVYPDFITEREEADMLAELEPTLKRMRYEFDHWDNAIHGFRETERTRWSESSECVLARVRALAFSPSSGAGTPLPHAHVLDLAAAGYIKPHVDAVRFCGDVIAGLCLVSSAVMHLEHTTDKDLSLHVLLARRSLYIMKGEARYSFSHAVLGGEHSVFRGEKVPRQRRVAVICRSQPRPRDASDGTDATVHSYTD
ncbi:alpha-ketoglutarate-dependent dioxygenase alkB homolog 7, mitochondrial [Anticarsia gemmatalis]|uniref:alpha-ketoglutarate-dependent dioxygenase alkB homolog 7, mitochondrial n=1 Tax=Anticarsia gemmatalis TaxID=129554 RepID=UPI003F75AA5B